MCRIDQGNRKTKKIKIFKIFKFSPPITPLNAILTAFTSLKNYLQVVSIKFCIFYSRGCLWDPKAPQWSSGGRRNRQKMSPKLTRKWTQPVHTHSRNTKIADFIACKNWIKIELLEIAYFPIPGVSMGLQRSIWKPKKEPKIPPKRTALTRRRPPNCAKTVRGLVLATPDELENDNMRVGKLRLRSTTFREHWSVQ